MKAYFKSAQTHGITSVDFIGAEKMFLAARRIRPDQPVRNCPALSKKRSGFDTIGSER
jgi:hypothetical protein